MSFQISNLKINQP